MITTLDTAELAEYTSRQLNNFFPDKHAVTLAPGQVTAALDKLEYCFNKVSLKHYNNGEHVLFNHLYSDHYVMYLWYLSNVVWKQSQDKELCNKIYYLNKTLHALDCMYDTSMPDIFLIFHGSGTMLGKASYADYFVALQGCTVGMNRGKYPVLGRGVSLTAHSSLIGDCIVGKLVTISSYTAVIDTPIDENTIVFRNNKGELIYKKTANSYAQNFFNVDLQSSL
jgi:serine O-acetyltransferase